MIPTTFSPRPLFLCILFRIVLECGFVHSAPLCIHGKTSMNIYWNVRGADAQLSDRYVDLCVVSSRCVVLLGLCFQITFLV